MAAAALPRPVPRRSSGYSATSDVPWWACPPGVLFRSDWTREQALIVHSWREAKKEVASWFTGTLYRWTDLDEAMKHPRKPGSYSGVPNQQVVRPLLVDVKR